MRRRLMISALALVAMATAACGGGGGSDSGTTAGGLTEVTVNIVPFSPNAVLFAGLDQGFFKKQGLTVKIERAASPILVVASLVAGQSQFGFVTTPVAINANREGTKLQCVSPVDGQISPDRDEGLLLAGADSGIRTIADLAGKKVAVVQLASIHLVAAKELMEEAGVTNEEFVALPFPQMSQALADGRVDAAVVTSPFAEQAVAAGATKLASPTSDLFPNGTIYCYGSTGKFLADKPEVAKKFRDAMTESILYAKDHEDEVKATLVKQMDLTAEQAKAQNIATNFVPELNVDSMAKIQNLMLKEGLITDKIDPADLVWQP